MLTVRNLTKMCSVIEPYEPDEELIELEIHGYYGNLDCLYSGHIHFRTPYLAKGDELRAMREFGAYMLDSGLIEDDGPITR